MFLDARHLDDGQQLEADLCIIGAGAAGISIAAAWAGRSRRVLLLESGGLDLDADTQALYQGHLAGLPYLPLEVPRLRFFGGSTNHWGGHCAALRALDFRARSWVPLSGWPITRDDLEPFDARARAACEIGAGEHARRPLPLDPERVAAGCWHLSPPARFGTTFRETLAVAENVDVVLHANVTRIAAEPGGAVSGLAVRTLGGRRLEARARAYVLACGGLENARLLLASAPPGMSRCVGRYYMGHPRVDGAAAGVLFHDGDRPTTYGIRPGVRCIDNLSFAEDVLQRERLLHTAFRLYFLKDPGGQEVERAHGLARQPRWMDPVLRDLARAVGSARTRTSLFIVRSHAEQVPRAESRVYLSDDRDALGMPRLTLDWRLGEQDRDSLRRSVHLLARAFGAAGAGRIRVPAWLEDPASPWPDSLFGSWHHMGTTRMGTDPATSVVDRDCRMHGIDNLYVAGSSVFPTGGWAPPTLTIVQLAYRLADHLWARA